MIHKGSVAVDGISLTINQCSAGNFEVSIIPHTAELTTIGVKNVGAPVNIETDMIGKYVEKFLMRHHQPRKHETTSVDMEFLENRIYINHDKVLRPSAIKHFHAMTCRASGFTKSVI